MPQNVHYANNPDEVETPEAKKSIIEVLRQKAGRGLSSRKAAEDAFALSVSEDNETPNPEDACIAKEALEKSSDKN